MGTANVNFRFASISQPGAGIRARGYEVQRKNPPTPNTGGDPIVEGLKRLYDDVIQEDVPDEFMSILKKIDEERTQKRIPQETT